MGVEVGQEIVIIIKIKKKTHGTNTFFLSLSISVFCLFVLFCLFYCWVWGGGGVFFFFLSIWKTDFWGQKLWYLYICETQIGADGSKSAVRSAANLHTMQWGYEQTAVVATLKLSEVVLVGVCMVVWWWLGGQSGRRLVDEWGRGLAVSALLPAFTVTLCSGATNREQSGC